eukprot:Selendium_serpulae@DN5485_c0_g1_i2.p1
MLEDQEAIGFTTTHSGQMTDRMTPATFKCQSCQTVVPRSACTIKPTVTEPRNLNWCAPEVGFLTGVTLVVIKWSWLIAQVLREARHFASDPKSDVYSFGLVLWEMVRTANLC